MDLLPRSEAAGRVGKLQSCMQDAALDAVFVMQNADLFYFSGTIQTGLFCVPASGEPLFLVQKSLARARNESPWERLVPISGLSRIPDVLSGEGLGHLQRVGLELDVLPAGHFLSLQDLLPGTRFVDASETIRTLRMIKSAYEVEQVRQAARILHLGFQEMSGWITPDVTELEIAARLEGFLRLQGHQGMIRMRAFNNEIAYGVVAGGPSASYPVFFPGPVGFVGLYPAIPNGAGLRRLAPGEPLMVDIVGGYGGYIADQTRTFAIGSLPDDMSRAHGFALELLSEVEAMLKPGVPCKRIYRRTLDSVKDSPYAPGFMGAGENQVRFIGHGVGLELDELPVLAAGFETLLAEGMIIAVEPKIFFPERGGVGVENTYLITATGFENLTPFPEKITFL